MLVVIISWVRRKRRCCPGPRGEGRREPRRRRAGAFRPIAVRKVVAPNGRRLDLIRRGGTGNRMFRHTAGSVNLFVALALRGTIQPGFLTMSRLRTHAGSVWPGGSPRRAGTIEIAIVMRVSKVRR